jgi:hypothetical protein
MLRHIVRKNLNDNIPIISQREPLIRMTLQNLIGLEICKKLAIINFLCRIREGCLRDHPLDPLFSARKPIWLEFDPKNNR